MDLAHVLLCILGWWRCWFCLFNWQIRYDTSGQLASLRNWHGLIISHLDVVDIWEHMMGMSVLTLSLPRALLLLFISFLNFGNNYLSLLINVQMNLSFEQYLIFFTKKCMCIRFVACLLFSACLEPEGWMLRLHYLQIPFTNLRVIKCQLSFFHGILHAHMPC